MASNVLFDEVKHEYSDPSGKVYKSVTQLLKLAGRLNHFGNATEEQANKGTSIHWMTRLEDEGKLNPRKLSRPMKLYRKGYVGWKKASGFIPTDIELPFISPLGYAGTVDRIGYFPETNLYIRGAAVVDLKTGSAIPACTGLQLVAYAKATFTFPCLRIAVRLLPDGTYRVKEFPLADFNRDWAEFYSLVRKYANH